MKAVIISYTLDKSNTNQKTAIHRVLYGYIDHSNNGAYNYDRKGLIKKYRYLKLNRGVIILAEKDKKEILSTLRKNKANIKIILIDIDSSLLK